mgnify:CR=1 FL=1
MTVSPIRAGRKSAGAALALSLAIALSGCVGGMPNNKPLESVNQPVVARTNYALDIASGAGGVPFAEQRRLAGWFEALNLRYGDRISLDDPAQSPATRSAIEAIAARHGILVGGQAPATPGYVNPGTTRVVVTRSSASVPGCPNWSDKSDGNFSNATSKNYGGATKGTPAAMVADPEPLIRGTDPAGETVIMSSDKAIDSYREGKPTGAGGLKQTSTSGN